MRVLDISQNARSEPSLRSKLQFLEKIQIREYCSYKTNLSQLLFLNICGFLLLREKVYNFGCAD